MATSQALLGHLQMPRALILAAGWNTRVKDVPTDCWFLSRGGASWSYGDSDFGKKSLISRAEVVGTVGD